MASVVFGEFRACRGSRIQRRRRGGNTIQKMKGVATRCLVEIQTMVEIKDSCSQPRLDLAGSCAPVFESGDDTYMKRAAIYFRSLGSSWKNNQIC